MKFAQIIDFETDRIDEMRALIQQFDESHAGQPGGPTHRLVLQDRNQPRRYLILIEFESPEEAARNDAAPDTVRLAEQLTAMCTRQPLFTNCDVREATELK
ncbi:hypothetical protein [Streptomyces sp. NPDC050504]|uniref:hypothetical protein n=1 Tax=Streptomyces sp. NPDC050504 TaxID=3365618 RepID=UPI0037AE868A